MIFIFINSSITQSKNLNLEQFLKQICQKKEIICRCCLASTALAWTGKGRRILLPRCPAPCWNCSSWTPRTSCAPCSHFHFLSPRSWDLLHQVLLLHLRVHPDHLQHNQLLDHQHHHHLVPLLTQQLLHRAGLAAASFFEAEDQLVIFSERMLVVLAPWEMFVVLFLQVDDWTRQDQIGEVVPQKRRSCPLQSAGRHHCCSLFENNQLSWQIVSDDKIQISLLVLRRGALSNYPQEALKVHEPESEQAAGGVQDEMDLQGKCWDVFFITQILDISRCVLSLRWRWSYSPAAIFASASLALFPSGDASFLLWFLFFFDFFLTPGVIFMGSRFLCFGL